MTTTIQLTSKSLKLQSVSSGFIFLVAGTVAAFGLNGEAVNTVWWATVAALAGAWYLVTRVRIWWHHD